MTQHYDVMVVLVTAPSQEVAERIVTAAVEENLAACGNILPGVTSIYRWEGGIQREGEVLIVFKTLRGTVPQLMDRVRQLHPYDVPEAIALGVQAGLEPYMRWVAANSTG